MMDYYLIICLSVLLVPCVVAYDCEVEQGREVNLEDDSCESYWTCKDYDAVLSHCEDDTQFDFAWRVCRPNREVWCQWQVHTVQRRGGLKGTPFDLSAVQAYSVRKPWLREMFHGQNRPLLTYNGQRPTKSYTHTHDGSTHTHLLDSRGQYIDTTDHFHESRGSPSIVRERREAKYENLVTGADVDAVKQTSDALASQKRVRKFHKRIGGEGKVFNKRSQELGMDYDVNILKPNKENENEEEGMSKNGNGEDAKRYLPETSDEDSGKDGYLPKDYEYNEYAGDDAVCLGGVGREPDLEDSECKLFWECTKESVSYLECDDDYLYDFEKKDCLPYSEVKCKEQLSKAKQTNSRETTVEVKKGKDMTVVHHYYHGGAKPMPGQLPDELFKLDEEDDLDLAGERTMLPLTQKTDFALLTSDDLSNSSEDAIIKRIQRAPRPTTLLGRQNIIITALSPADT
ncbi:filaggrin-2 [Biomphalaria pfeifferi]|uniref:Filaggrin-2 n=1 Tax=Biomphalaria pfeifferi TaxID=112525 RepID=A0AAD8BVT4_BIOPF|nr:filaggrin-2 [Biomphalaria pfeifferi]